jgi:DNA repair exonuclease SbcCD nuclease subunit
MITFIADIHIKLGQKNVPRGWAVGRYKKFFNQLKELEIDSSLLIVGGDVFDRMPTIEELELYFEWISNIGVKTLITTGNHEATKKGQSFLTQLKAVTNKLNPLVYIIDEDYIDPDLGFGIMPYESLHKLNSIEKFDTKYPLFTHVRGEIPPHVTPEIDLSRFDKFPVVFAGDLHAHSNSQRNIVYPGSPMTTSFHRSKVNTGYLLINEKDWSWVWREFDLPQLIRKTVTDTNEMIPGIKDHIIYELEGDMRDLAKVANTELLDKKVVKRNIETSLVLDKSMTLAEELVEYLTYILEISDDKIPSIVGLFNDYTKNIEMG